MSEYLFILPISLMLFLIFLIFLVFLPILFVNVIAFAFEKLGISWYLAYTILWLSLIGSFVNIPVGKLNTEEEIESISYINFFGITYPVPRIERVKRKTILAVNLGGCIIPLAVSAYILMRIIFLNEVLMLLKITIATFVAIIIFYFIAKPVKGMGIVMPFFIPPLISALLALILSPTNPTPVAYISGTLGTLIGADLLSIKKIKKLGASMVSIGGAGTFDGIFLTGIVAALLV